MKKILFVVIMVFLLTTFVSFAALASDLKPGEKAPDFTLKTLDGKTVKLSDFKGKVVILHFWKSN